MTAAAQLLDALDRAPDHAAREALIARCHPSELNELQAALVYRQFCTEPAEQRAAQQAAFQSFENELAAAADDPGRLRIIERARLDPQRGPAWLAEWKWQRTASPQDWLNRYLALLRAEPP